MSLGEDRVRTGFNPKGDYVVSTFKQQSANLIDDCQVLKDDTEDGETKRLWALAQTAYEEAAMWAVKAATA